MLHIYENVLDGCINRCHTKFNLENTVVSFVLASLLLHEKFKLIRNSDGMFFHFKKVIIYYILYIFIIQRYTDL